MCGDSVCASVLKPNYIPRPNLRGTKFVLRDVQVNVRDKNSSIMCSNINMSSAFYPGLVLSWGMFSVL